MTDDISATKHYRQAIATVCEGFTLPDAARKVLETALWNPPTESATTPAEVDEPALPPLPLCWTGSPVSVTWAEDGEITTRKVYTADQMREYARAYAATLARQLAEAREVHEAFAGDAARRLNEMESSLAAATRRLGVVEGLVGKWREESPNTQSAYDIHNRYGDALENCADELEAALTKEPTK